MHLVGLPLSALLPIFGLAAAAVVGLYILKLRRRPVAVPFEKLWERILRDKEATSLFSRLKRLLSLLLQLAILAALVLALGDPRTAVEVVKGRTLVVLVDTSASMKSRDGDAGKTRLEVAKDEVKKLVRGLGASDRMLVASMDAVITPLSPLTSDTGMLDDAANHLEAVDCRADFARALRYSLDTLRGTREPEIVVISDGGLGEPRDALGTVKLGDAKLSFIPVGSGKRNLAITQFSVRRYPLDKARYEVMIEVQNLGDKEEDVELSLYGDDVLVDLTKLHMKAGDRLPRFYPSLGGASRTLEARLSLASPGPQASDLHDDLAADDRAFAVLPERRRTKVLTVTPGNTYLEAALLLDEYLDVTTVPPAKANEAIGGKYDVAIFDGVSPSLRPGLPSLYIDPKEGAPVKIDPKKQIAEPTFDTLERKHPILRWTAFDNIGIASAAKLIPGEGDKVVGASNEGPLLIAGARTGTKFVVLGFDVRQSDLPLRIAWPVFLLNTINWFVEEDADYLSSFKTGEVWHIPAPLGAGTSVTLVDPAGQKHLVPVQDGRAVFFGSKAGFYKLLKPAGVQQGGDVMFAANLVDPVESAITPKTELVVDGKKGGEVAGFKVGVRRELWIYLLLAVAAISAIEWATYHRRVTV
ncbi:MAG: vWA domain-containing protein [Polyangiales bacterium]